MFLTFGQELRNVPACSPARAGLALQAARCARDGPSFCPQRVNNRHLQHPSRRVHEHVSQKKPAFTAAISICATVEAYV